MNIKKQPLRWLAIFLLLAHVPSIQATTKMPHAAIKQSIQYLAQNGHNVATGLIAGYIAVHAMYKSRQKGFIKIWTQLRKKKAALLNDNENDDLSTFNKEWNKIMIPEGKRIAPYITVFLVATIGTYLLFSKVLNKQIDKYLKAPWQQALAKTAGAAVVYYVLYALFCLGIKKGGCRWI